MAQRNVIPFPANVVRVGYRSYNFIDKSPVIYRIEDMMKAEGLTMSELSKEVVKRGRGSDQLLYRWFYGETRRPSFDKAAGVVDLLGYDVCFVKRKK